MVVLLKRLLFFLALTTPLLAEAEIYQWKDSQGNVHFSDQPHVGAKARPVQPLKGINNPAFNLSNRVIQVPYQNQRGSMVVQTRINGVAMAMIVDTGATLVVISPRMAQQAHIDTRQSKTVLLQTANGLMQAPAISIDEMQLNRLRQQHVQAVVQPVSDNPNIGLLGMSFLQAYRMSIDHQRQLIFLESR